MTRPGGAHPAPARPHPPRLRSSGRDPRQVELLPVSKRQPLALVREAAALGFPRFGENYVQEGVQKALEAPELGFVLIGPLQRNKARPALASFRRS